MPKSHQGLGQIFKWDDKKWHVDSLRFLGKWQIWQEVINGWTKIFKKLTKEMTKRASWQNAIITEMANLQRCQIRFFPHPLNGWHDHWTFVGGWGMGDFTDLVCTGRIFSQISLELEIPRHITVKDIFLALYVMSDIFVSAGYFSPRNLFTCSSSVFRTYNPLKSQMVGPQNRFTKHLVSWQMLISQSFLKAFETLGGKII